jgi:probable F420-dependent oxidoreductase
MKLGLVIMLAELEELQRAPSYPEIRFTAQRVEAAGLDSIWLYDHLLYRMEGPGTIGIWECWTVLSALAEATRKVELGTLVLCNSFRNPAILAKMASTLDEVSGGRFIFGIGAGWNKPEYEAFGIPFDRRVDRFEEALQIIRPLLKEGRVDFSGQYYQAKDCEIRPRGPRPEGPPLLIGGFGPRMLRLTARYADMWNTGYLGGPQTLENPLAEMRLACAEEGRDPQTLEVTGMVALACPGLAKPPETTENHLIGTEKEVAEALRGFERMGVSHLMFHLLPYQEAAVEFLVRVVEIYRGQEK